MLNIRDAYNVAAEIYRKKYDALSTRNDDVDAALSFVNKSNPFVVEIGCAYGREAKYILTKTNKYVGIDICDEFIEMAKQEILEGKFVRTDVLDYQFDKEIDIVFAFASLLHSSKEEMAAILIRISESLCSKGVIFLSLKRRDSYQSSIEDDGIVERKFYYYTRDVIKDILPSGFKVVFYDEQMLKEPWLTLILQKK